MRLALGCALFLGMLAIGYLVGIALAAVFGWLDQLG